VLLLFMKAQERTKNGSNVAAGYAKQEKETHDHMNTKHLRLMA
jgi:hypothetical protein